MKQPTSTASTSQKPSGPGENIRALRMSSGLTLSDISERTGLGVSAVSKLEKGRMSLTYDKLMLLSKALNVDMSQLLDSTPRAAAGSPGLGRRVSQRINEGRLVETDSYRHLYLATELRNKRFTPMVVEPKATSLQQLFDDYGDYIRHAGEEFAMVLEGEVDFHTELYEPLRLRAGDSVYFDSEMGHAYLKASDEICRVVAVCTPRGNEAGAIETTASTPDHLSGKLPGAIAKPPHVVRAKSTVAVKAKLKAKGKTSG